MQNDKNQKVENKTRTQNHPHTYTERKLHAGEDFTAYHDVHPLQPPSLSLVAQLPCKVLQIVASHLQAPAIAKASNQLSSTKSRT
jgi:hypothetical protein